MTTYIDELGSLQLRANEGLAPPRCVSRVARHAVRPYIATVSSLALLKGNRTVHRADGPWLYPLLDLEKWLNDNSIDTEELIIYDKIVGRAGSLLIARMGFARVRTDLISRLAIEIFDARQIAWEAAEVTDRILCETESELETVTDPEIAIERVRERARRATGRTRKTAFLRLQNVNVLRDGRHVLSAIDLSVSERELVLIRGENGAGKTTLLRATVGLQAVNTGTVTVLGQVVGSAEWSRHRHRVAYVRQADTESQLPVTVHEVVSMGAAARPDLRPRHYRRAADDALTLTGVAHLSHRPFARLSGGERRRVSLARAFAQEPALLVLDEPVAGLDDEARLQLFDVVESAAGERGVAVLMVSHDPVERSFEKWRVLNLVDGSLRAN